MTDKISSRKVKIKAVFLSGSVEPGAFNLAKNVLAISLIIYAIYMVVGFRWFYRLVFLSLLTEWQYYFLWPIYKYVITFALLLLLPLSFWRYKWGRPVREIGWQWGFKKRGLILTIIGALALVGIAFSTAADRTFSKVYPWERVFVDPGFGQLNIAGYILMEVFYVIAYYIPYEFFFRGFCQFPLVVQGKVRTTWVVLYTTAITTILHWDTPVTEFYAALAVGFIYGLATLKCDSLYYGLINHACVGLITNFICVLVLQSII
ncbi:MAG: CPBP family glutamic-type intramembrane protease [Promethearchaeota archaeon]